jgi:hypothetical protein
MLGNFWIQKAAPKFIDARERALVVGAYQSAVASDVACKNGRKSALERLARHILLLKPGRTH